MGDMFTLLSSYLTCWLVCLFLSIVAKVFFSGFFLSLLLRSSTGDYPSLFKYVVETGG